MKDLKKFRLENTGVSDQDSHFGMSVHQMLLNEAKGKGEPYQHTVISVMLKKQWIF